MKFSIATFLSDLTSVQRLRLHRSPNVKDCILGLKVPANNFRTIIATGTMFTPSSFFRKGAPNHVYIDLTRPPSNLTLGQCKFDLRSMSKMSKLCHVAYHSTRLDGRKVFILLLRFGMYSGSEGDYHKRNQRQCSV